MLIVELDGSYDPQGLLDRPPNSQIINGRMSDDPPFVDDKEPTQGHPCLLNQDSPVPTDRSGEIGEQGNPGCGSQTARLPRLLGPGQVSVFGIDRGCQHLTSDPMKVVQAVIEGYNLGWADKGAWDVIAKKLFHNIQV